MEEDTGSPGFIAMYDQVRAASRDGARTIILYYKATLEAHGRDTTDAILLQELISIPDKENLVGLVMALVHELAVKP